MFKMVVQKLNNSTGRYSNFGTFLSDDIDELYAMMETIQRSHYVFTEVFVRVNHHVGYVPIGSLDILLENVKDAIKRSDPNRDKYDSHGKALKAC